MASVTYTKSGTCGAGHFDLTRSGAFGGTLWRQVVEDYHQNPLTSDEMQQAEKLLLRLHCSGSVGNPRTVTKALLNTEFTAGVKFETSKVA